MKVGVIRNPVAGGATAMRRWRDLEVALGERFADLRIATTAGEGDGLRLARSFAEQDFDLIVAAGGDGTIGEVAGGIALSGGPDVAMALAPLGTGSDFARNFRLPDDPAALVERFASAPVTRIDLAVARPAGARSRGRGERIFANVASVGVSAPIVQAVNMARHGRILSGSLRFFFHSVREILRYRPVGLRVIADGREVFSGNVLVVAVANGAWFGGGMHVMPAARLDDGLLHLGIMPAKNRVEGLKILPKLYSARHVDDEKLIFASARRVLIEPLDARGFMGEADGEVLWRDGIEVEVLPGALGLKV